MYDNIPIGVTCANSIGCISKWLLLVCLCNVFINICHHNAHIRLIRMGIKIGIFSYVDLYPSVTLMMTNEHLDRKKVQMTKHKSLQSRCFHGLYPKIFEG